MSYKRRYWIVINGSGCHEMHLTKEAAEAWSCGEDEIVEVEEVLKEKQTVDDKLLKLPEKI